MITWKKYHHRAKKDNLTSYPLHFKGQKYILYVVIKLIHQVFNNKQNGIISKITWSCIEEQKYINWTTYYHHP